MKARILIMVFILGVIVGYSIFEPNPTGKAVVRDATNCFVENTECVCSDTECVCGNETVDVKYCGESYKRS